MLDGRQRALLVWRWGPANSGVSLRQNIGTFKNGGARRGGAERDERATRSLQENGRSWSDRHFKNGKQRSKEARRLREDESQRSREEEAKELARLEAERLEKEEAEKQRLEEEAKKEEERLKRIEENKKIVEKPSIQVHDWNSSNGIRN